MNRKKQAVKEAGLILTLESAAGNTLNDLSSGGKDTNKTENTSRNKEKTFEWVAMEAPLASSQPNKGLISATKVTEDFENPKISGER